MLLRTVLVGFPPTSHLDERMKEFSQASLLYHVFQKRVRYVNFYYVNFAQSSLVHYFSKYFLTSISYLYNCFLCDLLGETKTIRPFALKGYRSTSYKAN